MNELIGKKKLRIIMLTTVRLHLSKGGTEKVMIDTANALTEKGHDVTILYKDKKGCTPGFPLNKQVKTINCCNNHIPFMVSGLMRVIRSFSFSREKHKEKLAFLKLKKLAATFKKPLMENPADIYITYEPKLSAMLNKEFNISGNVITTFQLSPEYIANRPDTKYIEKYIGTAGPIQILREEFLQRTREYFPSASQITVIPNAIAPNKNTSSLNNKIITNLGRVSKIKNQLLLVESFNLIREDFKDWKIEIWGETGLEKEYEQNIKNLIKKYNLTENFIFRGTTNEVYKELINSSIFAFPSIDEGFGLALGEAMATGLPCIGLVNCPSVNTLIKHNQNGLLCNNNPYEFSQALRKLMENHNLRIELGRQAKKDISLYDPQHIWKLWEEFLYRNANSTQSTIVH